MSRHSATRLTYEDYLQFPDDGLRHEIIEGEHYVSPPPLVRHQRILLRLSYLIQAYLETHAVGEIFFAPFAAHLSEFNVFEPDLVFISSRRASQLTEKDLKGSPDIAVEILSSSTKSRDKRLKRDVYERAGVEEYWIVDGSANVIEVYRRDGGPVTPTLLDCDGRPVTDLTVERGGRFVEPLRYDADQTLTTPLLPGLELSLQKIFA